MQQTRPLQSVATDMDKAAAAARMALLHASGALGVVAAYLALVLVACVMCAQPADVPAPELLPIPDDRSLMTEANKAFARQDGWSLYYWDGWWYVDPNVPPIYYKE